MKRERELKIIGSIKGFGDGTGIMLDGDYDYNNLKVILTEEVEEYVEIVESNPYFNVGSTYRVLGIGGGNDFKLQTHSGDDYWYIDSHKTKPSTKEAYEAQFKVKKVTMTELEEVFGCKVEIVKEK